MTEQEMQAVLSRCDERYMQKSECGVKYSSIERKIYEDSAKLAVIESKVKLILWVLTAIGGGIITMLVKMFFGG